MVKCLVCGAVFEEGIEVCPVCGVGPENFVPVESDHGIQFSLDTDEMVVILGTGIAALSAATALRERNADCDILMLSNERALPYNRPMLTKNMLQKNGRDAFAVHGASWYAERNIRLITDEIVSSLDTERKLIGLSDDTTISYDKCIYALGARSFVPPLTGTHLPEAVTIRSLDDIERIAKLITGIESAVVIGGGVLGLEAAWELKKAGLAVTVLEASERLLKRQLDLPASELLQSIAVKNDIQVRTDAITECIEGDEHVSGVRLKDGVLLPAQLVIVSTGVRANTKIAEDAGLTVKRAVVVNQYMETSAKNVWACGDCAEFDGVNYSIWPEATQMGETAGANAAGEHMAYSNPLPGLTLNTMHTSLFAIGDVGVDPHQVYEVTRTCDENAKTMHTEYHVNGKLVGGILIGDPSSMEALLSAMPARG